MNEQQKIRALTWKYFWKQKVEEIKEKIPFIISLIFILSLLFMFSGAIMMDEEILGGNIIFLVGTSILLSLLLVGVISLLNCFLKWIKSNWKKAKEKSVAEVKYGHK